MADFIAEEAAVMVVGTAEAVGIIVEDTGEEDADSGAEAMAIGQALPLRLLRWDMRQLDHHHSILLLRSMDVRHVARENFADG